MTTEKQVGSIYKVAMARHKFLKPTGNRMISIVPINHLVKGVFIERSSDPNICWPMLTITALFLRRIYNDIALGTYHEKLSRPETSPERLWLWSDVTMVGDAIDVIERVALPKLLSYGTPRGYSTLPLREQWVHYEPREDRMLVHIAADNLDAARTIWYEREPIYRGKSYHPDSRLHCWQTQLAAVREPLLAGDKQALAGILHEWEAANVRGTSIERYWEPTPFPLEMSGESESATP